MSAGVWASKTTADSIGLLGAFVGLYCGLGLFACGAPGASNDDWTSVAIPVGVESADAGVGACEDDDNPDAPATELVAMDSAELKELVHRFENADRQTQDCVIDGRVHSFFLRYESRFFREESARFERIHSWAIDTNVLNAKELAQLTRLLMYAKGPFRRPTMRSNTFASVVHLTFIRNKDVGDRTLRRVCYALPSLTELELGGEPVTTLKTIRAIAGLPLKKLWIRSAITAKMIRALVKTDAKMRTDDGVKHDLELLSFERIDELDDDTIRDLAQSKLAETISELTLDVTPSAGTMSDTKKPDLTRFALAPFSKLKSNRFFVLRSVTLMMNRAIELEPWDIRDLLVPQMMEELTFVYRDEDFSSEGKECCLCHCRDALREALNEGYLLRQQDGKGRREQIVLEGDNLDGETVHVERCFSSTH